MKNNSTNTIPVFILINLFFSTQLIAATIHVPGDYPDIQTGIIFASNGDTVLVAPGTYSGLGFEDIDLLGKSIVIMSEQGPELTIIDGEGYNYGFNINKDEDENSEINGFKIINFNTGIYLFDSGTTIKNCHFDQCKGIGILINNYFHHPTISGCTIENSGSFGIRIRITNSRSVTIENCQIYKNNGGGIDWYNSFGSPTVTVSNCTITENNSTGDGGGIKHNTGGTLYIVNSIIFNNTSSNPIFNEIFSLDAEVSYSNIGAVGWPGTGNINTDPLFTDPANNDYRLMSNSPCIDTADNDVVDYPTDFDGNVRIWDGDGNGDARVDMGAYEFGAPPYQPLAITGQPTAMEVCEGGDANFSVSATGIMLTYQWFHNANELPGETDSTLMLSNVAASAAGTYTCVVTDLAGTSITSQPASLQVNASVMPAVEIDTDNTICAGSNVTFSASSNFGGTSPSYQWQVNGVDVGANEPTYSSSSLNAGDEITCILTSSELCVFENPVTSNTLSVLPLPDVPITNNSTVICEGETIDITASGGINYEWDGPNNFSGTSEAVLISNASLQMDGNYSVSVTDAAGCMNTGSTSVQVNELPDVAYMPDVSSICIDGNPLELSSGTPVGGTYEGNGIENNILTPQNAGAGTVEVTYTYEDSSTGCSNADMATIEINELPTVEYNPPQTTFCIVGETVQLSGGIPAGGTYSGEGVSGGMFDPATAGEGSHLITYSYQDPVTGCANENTAFLEVNSATSVSVTITSSTDTICSEEEVIFTAIPGNGGSSPEYQWYLNGIQAGDNSNIFITPISTTNQVVTCELTSSDQCVANNPAMAAYSIPVVHALPGEPNTSNNSPECVNGQVELNALAGGGVTYQWSGPNGFMASGPTVIIENVSLQDSGSYSVVISTVEGCSAIEMTTVVINPNPDVGISPNCFPDTILTTTPPFVLDCGIPAGGTFFCNSLECTTFDPMAAGIGEHTITYQYTDANGCTAAYSTTVIVEMGTSSLEQVLDNQLIVFPNPSNGSFSITATGIKGPVRLILVNNLGQQVWQTEWDFSKNGEITVPENTIESGTYWAILMQEGQLISRKINVHK